jgi:hypothetical protein
LGIGGFKTGDNIGVLIDTNAKFMMLARNGELLFPGMVR